jgi:pilus assembly protein Flp/PilA
MKLDFLKKFVGDESGASMVEYGLALLVVTGIGVGAMNALGQNTGQLVSGACGILNEGVTEASADLGLTPEAC